MSVSSAELYVKPYVKNVTVVYDIVFTFYHQLARLLACMLRAQADKVIILHHLGPDESSFEVRVNDAGGLGCRHAFSNGPGAYLLRSHRKKSQKVQHRVGSPYQLVHSRLREPRCLQELHPVRKICQ